MSSPDGRREGIFLMSARVVFAHRLKNRNNPAHDLLGAARERKNIRVVAEELAQQKSEARGGVTFCKQKKHQFSNLKNKIWLEGNDAGKPNELGCENAILAPGRKQARNMREANNGNAGVGSRQTFIKKCCLQCADRA